MPALWVTSISRRRFTMSASMPPGMAKIRMGSTRARLSPPSPRALAFKSTVRPKSVTVEDAPRSKSYTFQFMAMSCICSARVEASWPDHSRR